MTSTPKLDGKGWLLIGILAILWGGAFFLIEIGLRSFPADYAGVHPRRLCGARYVDRNADHGRKTALGLGQLASVDGCRGRLTVRFLSPFSFGGQQYLDSGYAAILNATTPLWGVLTAHFLTHDEKATPARINGVLTGMAGIIVMVGPAAILGLSNNVLAQIACVISTVFYSLAAIYGRRLSQTTLTPMAVATGQTMMAAVLMIPIVMIVDQPWTMDMPRLDATLAGPNVGAAFNGSCLYTLFPSD